MSMQSAKFWVPAYLAAAAATAAIHPHSFSRSVHWAESAAWCITYPFFGFVIGYWLVRLAAAKAHPGWRAAGGLALVLIQLALAVRG